MSFVVFAIGAAHALPPLVGAAVSRSRSGTLLGAAVGAVIAFASGNPAFVAVDLMGLGIGTWLGLSMVPTKPN